MGPCPFQRIHSTPSRTQTNLRYPSFFYILSTMTVMGSVNRRRKPPKVLKITRTDQNGECLYLAIGPLKCERLPERRLKKNLEIYQGSSFLKKLNEKQEPSVRKARTLKVAKRRPGPIEKLLGHWF